MPNTPKPVSYLLAVMATTFSFTGIIPTNERKNKNNQNPEKIKLIIYKTPSCTCHKNWKEHLISHHFNIELHETTELNAIKKNYAIPRQYQSCHTTVSEQGYVFEGPVPAPYITQFLQSPPKNAIGLSVPSTSIQSSNITNSKGIKTYQVVQLNKNSSSQTYAVITDDQ